ncbi:MAG: uroporphyrinogen-III synthase [Balneolales bacterium]
MQILSTRKTTEEEEQLARRMGFQLISYPLLKFEYIKPNDAELDDLWEMSAHCWVFTSKNGVEGFARLFEQGMVPVKPKKVFAVGKKTAIKLRELEFYAEVPEVNNGSALAELIVEDGTVKSVIHFCGNLRRRELSEILGRNHIKVKDLVVYKTIREKPQNNYPKDIDAVLIYSPSAVEAYKELFGKLEELPTVAIGATTAAALREMNCKKVIEAEDATTKSMLAALKQYFRNSNNGT